MKMTRMWSLVLFTLLSGALVYGLASGEYDDDVSRKFEGSTQMVGS